VTESPSEAPGNPVAAYAAQIADLVGATSFSADYDTVRLYVDRGAWVESIRKARDEAGLEFFSWLSAVDWSRDVEVGDPVEDVDALEERFEVMCRLSSVESWEGAQFIALVPKKDPVIDSLVPVFAGAEWHEREAAEMFGLDFAGHPNLINLYLPDRFEGNPLRKSFALLAREVKPWPGTVDVEGMSNAVDDEDAETSAADDGTPE
jgi:NADH-quinone oxidoreductase subunit C